MEDGGKDEEKMELLEKIKEARNGPEQVDRRIRELDKMIARLKQNRLNCGAALERDRETLSWIDKEIASIRTRYDPLCAFLLKRQAERERVKEQIERISSTFAGLLQSTKDTVRSTHMKEARHFTRTAREKLIVERGYSTGREYRPYALASKTRSRRSTPVRRKRKKKRPAVPVEPAVPADGA
eukprot:PLAT11051.1.p2 GENE.PLAT11051.1~~PLAT11051.1.p2  ORF type:complete len:183 (-),score=52.94 PLAT11051.1:171-719(-)